MYHSYTNTSPVVKKHPTPFLPVNPLTVAKSAPYSVSSDYPTAVAPAASIIRKIKKLLENAHYNAIPFWIGGGSLQCLITGYPVNDYDIFSSRPHELVNALKAIAETNHDLEVGHTNDNFTNFYLEGQFIQVISRFAFASAAETIKAFDFTIVSAAFDGQTFTHHPRYYMDIASRKIVAENHDARFRFPLNSMERVVKYAGRGFSTCPVLLRKLLKEINEIEIDWDDPAQDVMTFYPDGSPRFTGID